MERAISGSGLHNVVKSCKS